MPARIFQPFGIGGIVHQINFDEVRRAPGAVEITGDTGRGHILSNNESIILIGFERDADVIRGSARGVNDRQSLRANGQRSGGGRGFGSGAAGGKDD